MSTTKLDRMHYAADAGDRTYVLDSIIFATLRQCVYWIWANREKIASQLDYVTGLEISIFEESIESENKEFSKPRNKCIFVNDREFLSKMNSLLEEKLPLELLYRSFLSERR